MKDELSIHFESVLLKNGRVIMPKSLKARAIQLGHEDQVAFRTNSFVRT
jgi:hypothetical protein